MSTATAPGITDPWAFGISDRMRKTLEVRHVSVGGAARRMKVHRNTVSNWINGKVPSEQVREHWSMKFQINPEWLETGEGDPEGPSPTSGYPRTFARSSRRRIARSASLVIPVANAA